MKYTFILQMQLIEIIIRRIRAWLHLNSISDVFVGVTMLRPSNIMYMNEEHM